MKAAPKAVPRKESAEEGEARPSKPRDESRAVTAERPRRERPVREEQPRAAQREADDQRAPRRNDSGRDASRRDDFRRDDLGPPVLGFGDDVPAFMLLRRSAKAVARVAAQAPGEVPA